MKNEHSLDSLLQGTAEIEEFLHTLLIAMAKRRHKPGEDVTKFASELGLKIPEVFKGTPITVLSAEEAESAEAAEKGGARTQTLVLTRPGNADALGLVMKCVRIGRWKACLECGWLYCRIVISRRF